MECQANHLFSLAGPLQQVYQVTVAVFPACNTVLSVGPQVILIKRQTPLSD